MSGGEQRPLSMTDIATLTNMPKQLVAYHLPSMVEDGIMLRDGNRYRLQSHFYRTHELCELLMPLIEEIALHLEAGDNRDLDRILLNNVNFFLANVAVEVDG